TPSCPRSNIDRFKAAVVSGVLEPDLIARFLDSRPGWGSNAATGEVTGQGRMGVQPWEDRVRWLDNSIFWDLPRITAPLLIFNGDDDVSTAGADGLFEALQVLGKTAEYRLYENEGHVPVLQGTILDAWSARLAFLARNLNVALDKNGAVIFDHGHARAAK